MGRPGPPVPDLTAMPEAEDQDELFEAALERIKERVMEGARKMSLGGVSLARVWLSGASSMVSSIVRVCFGIGRLLRLLYVRFDVGVNGQGTLRVDDTRKTRAVPGPWELLYGRATLQAVLDQTPTNIFV